MLANYGYEDASGNYYIRIDTSICAECAEHGCVSACPGHAFFIEPDDWDDDVAVVRPEVRNTLKALCAACKPLETGRSFCRVRQPAAATPSYIPGSFQMPTVQHGNQTIQIGGDQDEYPKTL